MTPKAPAARITILLCTRNAGRYLADQLASFLDQDHSAWDLWVSDDGSQDDSVARIDRFARDHADRHHVRRIAGPRNGLAANYLSALCHPDFPPGPVALSDQDDVWQADKLTRALDHLGPCTGPALYGAQYTYTDAALRPMGTSTAPPLPPGFGNALVQNIVSGHTATLNAAGLALVRRAGVPHGITYHDWWLYQLISGAGGQVVIDDRAVLLYRQHGANAMGGHHGMRAGWTRLRQVLNGTYGAWMHAHRTALRAQADLLGPDARTTLDMLEAATAPRRGRARMRLLKDAGLHRAGRAGQAALMSAAFLGRV